MSSSNQNTKETYTGKQIALTILICFGLFSMVTSQFQKITDDIRQRKWANENMAAIATAIFKTPEGDIVETEIAYAGQSGDEAMITLRLCDNTKYTVPVNDLIIYRDKNIELTDSKYAAEATMNMPDGTLLYANGICKSIDKIDPHEPIQVNHMYQVQTATREYYIAPENIFLKQTPVED